MTKKIQLNEEQWRQLLALREAHLRRHAPAEALQVSWRLRSNGLVIADREGRTHLTAQGLARLSQGR
ncbi:hypothetical protein QTH87_14035 [Variovorax sp. J22P168]|uniref:hypothetical protein n=1 Tax=Variovorax jilinensis TaxID=3053513 RepID=UPI002578953F|nr:hypothetical protein [Variovorax sp. J22P168]MDM0013555.1 hypothetical protein [Variovorax sp. J22P168]